MERKEKSILRQREAGDRLPYLPEALREEFRQRLLICLSTVRSYDGTEAARQQLLLQLRQFEEWEFAHFAKYFHEEGRPRLSQATEEALLRHYHPEVIPSFRTISGLLAYTTERFLKRLQLENEAFISTRAQYLDGTVLPTGPGSKLPNEGKGYPFDREAVFSPRVRLLLGALHEQGVHLEDVILWVGDVPEGALKRQHPYIILEIPRLPDRQILLCDQVNEKAMVTLMAVDRAELLKANKAALKAHYGEGIQEVTWHGEEAWKDQIISLVFLNVERHEKVDIALRESIRREIHQKFPPQTLIDPNGKILIDIDGSESGSAFMVQGRKFTVLAQLFGLSKAVAASRTRAAVLRFLQAVFPGDPYLRPIAERIERDGLFRSKSLDNPDAIAKLREEVCQEIRTRFPIETLIAPDGTFLGDLRSHRRVAHFVVRGRKFMPLATLLGVPRELVDARNDEAALRFLEIIFPGNAYLRSVLEKDEQNEALQEALGNDHARWVAYIKGGPCEVAYKSGEKEIRYTQYPLPDRATFWKTSWFTIYKKYSYAGLRIQAILEKILVGEDLVRWQEYGEDGARSVIAQRLLEKTLFGAESPEEIAPDPVMQDREILEVLGRDPVRWRAYLQGEEITITHGQTRAKKPLPTLDVFLGLSRTEVDKFKVAGKTFNFIAGMFASIEPELLQYPSILDDNLGYYLLGRAIYGPSLEVDQKIRTLRLERLACARLGKDPDAWRAFIKGEPLMLQLAGEEITYRPEESFLRAEDFVTRAARSRRTMLFAGIGLQSKVLEELFKPRRGATGRWDPGNSRADLERLGLGIFGDEQVCGESLRARVERYDTHESTQVALGTSLEKWRAFASGVPVEIMTDKGPISVSVERVFKDRAELLALTSRQRRKLRFAGLGLEALANRIGLRGKSPASTESQEEAPESGTKTNAYIYTGAGFEMLAEQLFP